MNIRYLQNGEPTTNTTSILWRSKTLPHNLGVSISATPTSPLWESGTLAEDKGVL